MNSPIYHGPSILVRLQHDVPNASVEVTILTEMLLNVHLPRVVLVHDAEDFVDQTAFLLQDAATSVENPTVFSWDQT